MSRRHFTAGMPSDSIRILACIEADDWVRFSFLSNWPIRNRGPDPNRDRLISTLNGQSKHFVRIGVDVLVDRVDVIDLLVIQRDDFVALLELAAIRRAIFDDAGNP